MPKTFTDYSTELHDTRTLGWVTRQRHRPTRPSAKVAPVGCQLATTALKNVHCRYPKTWVAQQKLSPNLGRQCFWAELQETGGPSDKFGSKSAGTLSCNLAHAKVSNFFFVVVVRSDRNSDSWDVCCCTLEVLHRAVDPLPHRCVSRPSFCYQVMVRLTI